MFQWRPQSKYCRKSISFWFCHFVYFYICADSMACSTTSFQLMQSINHENLFCKMTTWWQSKESLSEIKKYNLLTPFHCWCLDIESRKENAKAHFLWTDLNFDHLSFRFDWSFAMHIRYLWPSWADILIGARKSEIHLIGEWKDNFPGWQRTNKPLPQTRSNQPKHLIKKINLLLFEETRTPSWRSFRRVC